MTRTVRSRSAALAFVLTMLAAMFGTASPASAQNPTLPIDWNVDISTHFKSLGMDVELTGGSFQGEVDLVTWDLTGNLTLPPATLDMKIGFIKLASVTFEMSQAQPITGHVALAAGTVTTTAAFNVRLASIRPLGLRLNLVGNNCRAVSPISASLTGPFSLTGEQTFTSTYTMPKLKGCGLLTPILNLIVPGSGNTMTATFGPKAV